jgi:hypothetical protein
MMVGAARRMRHVMHTICTAPHQGAHSEDWDGDEMVNRDGSDECKNLAALTLGYLRSLAEQAQTDDAREMVEDWAYLVEKATNNLGDVE